MPTTPKSSTHQVCWTSIETKEVPSFPTESRISGTRVGRWSQDGSGEVDCCGRVSGAKALCSFLGLASYYRKCMPNFGKIAGPLHAVTKKDVPFQWTQNVRQLSLS